MTPIASVEFENLKSEIESYPRLSGYYLIKLVDIKDLRQSNSSEEDLIDKIFQYFDDHKWPPKEERPTDQKWADYIVYRGTAVSYTVQSLKAGPPKGHLRPTIEARIAALFFDRFDTMFYEPKSYYIGMGFGNPEYVFCEGVAIVSTTRAGLLWVVEND